MNGFLERKREKGGGGSMNEYYKFNAQRAYT